MNKIDLKGKTILVTGSAGFIGSNLVLELLRTESEATIIGLDNMNDYYDVSIKEWRLAEIDRAAAKSTCSYKFIKGDLADKALIDSIEYSRAVTPQIRQAGNRLSGLAETAYASLLA